MANLIQFEKIKPVTDKRLALEKRGKPAPNDFAPGDSITLVEKVDGYNVSFNTAGVVCSRKNIIQDDWSNHGPILGIKDFVTNDEFMRAVANAPGLEAGKEYQLFGEYMVDNRIIQYKDNVSQGFHMFDIYDLEAQKYLGIDKAIEVANYLKENASSNLSDRILIPNVIERTTFTSYEDMEELVYSSSGLSKFSVDGNIEGAVVTNLSRSFQNNPIRAKIINSEYKEAQRELQTPAKTATLRWLSGYLTPERVEKQLLDLRDEGVLNPKAQDYFTDQLAMVTDVVTKDILSESMDTPTFSDKDKKDVFNKVEGYSRLAMLDFRNYKDAGKDMPDLNDALADLMQETEDTQSR